jgi:hypothetical protein
LKNDEQEKMTVEAYKRHHIKIFFLFFVFSSTREALSENRFFLKYVTNIFRFSAFSMQSYWKAPHRAGPFSSKKGRRSGGQLKLILTTAKCMFLK